jgi:hypothetical protein
MMNPGIEGCEEGKNDQKKIKNRNNQEEKTERFPEMEERSSPVGIYDPHNGRPYNPPDTDSEEKQKRYKVPLGGSVRIHKEGNQEKREGKEKPDFYLAG